MASSAGSPGARLADKCCAWVLARISGVEPLLVGEDDETVGIDQVGDQRTKRVVVAELDLVGNNGVIFIDDRHGTERQQRA